MRLFERKTKWIPLIAYNNNGTDYFVLVRKGIKSGMIYFKTKDITPFSKCSYNFRSSIFDIKEQFSKLLDNPSTD